MSGPNSNATQKSWLERNKTGVIILILGSPCVLGGTCIGVASFLEDAGIRLPRPSAQIAVSAEELTSAFDKNAVAAEKKYADKVVRVSGEVGSISKTFGEAKLSIRAGVLKSITCHLEKSEEKAAAKLAPGDTVHVEGRVGGGIMGVGLGACVIVSDANVR